jgi:hypothetical protein
MNSQALCRQQIFDVLLAPALMSLQEQASVL